MINDIRNNVKFILTKHKDYILSAFMLIAIIAFCLLQGRARIFLSNFYAINGDFQSFNVIRRLLQGQVPYKDFFPYLGLGHLYISSFFTWIFGGDFTDSLFAINTLILFIFAIMSFVISYIILGNYKFSFFSSLVLTTINIIRPKFFASSMGEDLDYSLYASLTPGNSVRIMRGFGPILLIILILVGLKIIEWLSNKYSNVSKLNGLIKKCYIAFVAGCSVLFSNDYGISTYVCFSFVYFLVMIKIYKGNYIGIIKSVGIYILSSLVGFFVLLSISTHCHYRDWYSFTVGSGTYQSWYYWIPTISRDFYLYNLDHYYLITLIFLFAVFFCVMIFKNSKTDRELIKNSLLAFLLFTNYFTANLYKMLSGNPFRDIPLLVLFLIMLFSFIELIRSSFSVKIKTSSLDILIIVCLFFSYSFIIQTYIDQNKEIQNRESFYISELGGYEPKNFSGLKVAQEIVADDKVFSTYASAIETMTDQFQPSGTDYIIHVLGDEQREKYMEVFREGNFKYVTTLRPDYDAWEYWIKGANWFFYREMLNRYQPEFAINYQIYWTKSDKENVIHPEFEIDITQTGNEYIINLQSKDNALTGTADIEIEFNIQKSNNDINSKFLVSPIVTLIEESGFYKFCLPAESGKYYIPVTIINGVGEVNINCQPTDDLQLDLLSVKTEGFYFHPYNFLLPMDLTDGNWINGVSADGKVILLLNTPENALITSGLKKIKFNDSVVNVEHIESDDAFIKLHFKEGADLPDFQAPHIIYVAD